MVPWGDVFRQYPVPLFPCSTGHLLTESEGLFLVLREHRLVAFFLMFGVEHGPVVAAVILDLQGVGTDQDFGRTNEGAQTPPVALQHGVIADLRIEIFGSITGHDHQHGNLPFVVASNFRFIGQRLENQPLKQRTESGSHIA